VDRKLGGSLHFEGETSWRWFEADDEMQNVWLFDELVRHMNDAKDDGNIELVEITPRCRKLEEITLRDAFMVHVSCFGLLRAACCVVCWVAPQSTELFWKQRKYTKK
jgi:hypothetical protein